MNKSKTIKIAAGFGAALGTMYLSPSVDADIVDLTGNLPGTLSSSRQNVDFIGGTSADWLQWNDTVGRTITAAGYLNGLVQTSISNTLTGGEAFTNSIAFSASFSGTATFGFRTLNNQLGWIQLRYSAGNSTPIEYLGAAFENIAGNSIHVGTVGVPEPSSAALAGLAALAIGSRRRRKK